MPPAYVPRNAFTDKTSNGLTKAVIRFLQLQGAQAERINTMGRVLKAKVIKGAGYTVTKGRDMYIPTTGTRGSADISATIKGRSVKIEVKIGADRMSEAQHAYKADIERAGGIYMIAKTFEQFTQDYENLFNQNA